MSNTRNFLNHKIFTYRDVNYLGKMIGDKEAVIKKL